MGFFIAPNLVNMKGTTQMSDLPARNKEALNWRSDFVVMKFGGTSVEDAAAIRRVSQLVRRQRRYRPIVVVSALAEVTDQLVTAGKSAAEGKRESAKEILERLRQRHAEVAAELLSADEHKSLCSQLERAFQLLHTLIDSIAADGQFAPRVQDHFLGLGEFLSSKLLSFAFLASGLEAAWVDARQCIITDAAHTRATPLWEETNQRVESVLLPLLQTGRVPVLGGFVGSTRDGIPTTLGRGGSDFSAAIVGAALGAQRIEIWTDVDGVMTTDPDLCVDARLIEKMSFDRHDIPVWVRNSRNPECSGTEILAHTSDDIEVKAISVKRGVASVDVEPLRWLAPELVREVCDVFERHHYSLDLLSASRGSLSVLVSTTAALPAIAEELQGLAKVRWKNHQALVCLVGEKIRRRPDIASRVFRAISDIDVRMICQGASERNISFLVDESKAEEAVQRLHRLFFPPEKVQPSDDSSHALCQAGESWV
ncbi:MAG: lysine-sensitive aspartokinase 3 [Acidobacteria bacterium]|nr:MAG: lysine-sensitive aspartokinase 3 [Acidobacteriota bacterium]